MYRSIIIPSVVNFVLALAAGCAGETTEKLISAAQSSSGATASARSELGYITDFSPKAGGFQVSASALEIFRDEAYVLEDQGRLRIFDAATRKLNRALELLNPLISSRPAGGDFMGRLLIFSDNLALATRSGTGKESILTFNPLTAAGAADVQAFSVEATIAFTGSKTRADGTAATSPITPSFTSAVALFGSTLFVSTSNLDTTNFNNPAHRPATVQVFQINTATRTVTLPRQATIFTSGFNITGLTLYLAPGGKRVLLATQTFSSATVPAAIEVINPDTRTVVATMPLGQINPQGDLVVLPGGLTGFVGSQTRSEIYELDLSGLEAQLANTQVATLNGRLVQTIALSSAEPNFNSISDLALDPTGRYLAAANFNDRRLSIIDTASPTRPLKTAFTAFSRSSPPDRFENNLNFAAWRTQGTPDLLALCVNVIAADQHRTDVEIVVDAVTTGTR